jgi:asparagine N-glycosylation enzyme membrane subunit Stt3
MTKAQVSALSGVVVAVVSVLVSRGVLGGETADNVQTVLSALIAFGATVGIRSARP